MKTFIKWPGNKQKHLKHILPHVPSKFNRYIEPFLGSGSLYLCLQPQNSILNDCNKDLIDIWNLIKTDYRFIVKSFKKFGSIFIYLSHQEKLELCKTITNSLNAPNTSKKRSVQLLLMIFCAYMGILVINNRYRFQGLEKRIYVDNKYYFLSDNYYQRLEEVSILLNSTDTFLYNKDYKSILKLAKKDDFIFLDPPYIYDYNTGFNYNKHEKLDIQFLEEIFNECKKLDKKKVKWLMTQADTEIVRRLFKQYNIIRYPVYRPIKNEYTDELLIKNY